MAKKKKSQLKPVARGFATTSVPKKKTVLEDTVEDESHPSSAAEEEKSTLEDGPNGGGVGTQVANDEFDPEKVEEQSLQNLVDSKQEKVSMLDIISCVYLIEMSKVSQEIARYDFFPILFIEIFILYLDL